MVHCVRFFFIFFTNKLRMGHDVFELGLGLGTCKWRVAIGTMRTLTLTRVSSQPGAGETEHRQRGLFDRPGSPEKKTADPVPSCRSLDRPLARSAEPDDRSSPELSISRSAARQVSRARQPNHPGAVDPSADRLGEPTEKNLRFRNVFNKNF